MLTRVPGRGFRWASRNGRVYFGINGPLYTFHLEIYRFSISWANRDGK